MHVARRRLSILVVPGMLSCLCRHALRGLVLEHVLRLVTRTYLVKTLLPQCYTVFCRRFYRGSHAAQHATFPSSLPSALPAHMVSVEVYAHSHVRTGRTNPMVNVPPRGRCRHYAPHALYLSFPQLERGHPIAEKFLAPHIQLFTTSTTNRTQSTTLDVARMRKVLLQRKHVNREQLSGEAFLPRLTHHLHLAVVE